MNGVQHLTTDIQWKGTPGVGDFMSGLNVAHVNAFLLNKPVTLNMHWFWKVKEPYHFEDPELTIERLEYIHNFYKDQHMVKVNHIFDSTDSKVYVNITRGGTERLMRSGTFARFQVNNWWHFREDAKLDPLPTDQNKVVFWRDTFNADIVRPWKRLINHSEWDRMMANFQVNGYEPVELTYRTPVREAMYHINTCQFCVCYDGLWHYIAKNFHKPLIVVSRSSVTRVHTPEALTLEEKNWEHYSKSFSEHKMRHIIFPTNRVDKQIRPHKRIRVNGDGIHQLKKRINLYEHDLNSKLDEIKEYISRQSSN
jgi:hypothetical protein